jgi:hypothetical protein
VTHHADGGITIAVNQPDDDAPHHALCDCDECLKRWGVLA